MRICQVIASHGEGGLERHVRELTHQLIKAGHEVIVFGNREYLVTLPESAGRQPIHTRLGRRNPLLLLQLLLCLRHQHCDLIHAQANKAAALVGALRNWITCPIIGTLHNIKRDVRSFQRLDHIITVSRGLAVSFDPSRVSVVYNGIDQPRVGPTDLKKTFHLPDDRPLLCSVGRLVKAKGFDLLLDAIDGLSVNMLIVGEGPERRHLERRIERLAPDTQVRLLGHRNDAASLMAAADAVIISSRREGFSYVFNEALLVGARVLSTDVPVANEVLPPDLIVPVNDAPALRSRLQILLCDMDGWSVLMEQARAFAREHMTLNAMVANTLAVYEKLLGHE